MPGLCGLRLGVTRPVLMPGPGVRGYGNHKLEGRIIATALSALRLGFNVVLDFAVWAKDERTALRWLAWTAGADCKLVYSAIDEAEQRERVSRRFATAPESTFSMTEGDLAEFRMIFQTPDEDELNGSTLDPPPSGFDSWSAWAAKWWPTSLG
jgi:predicted kinase